MNCKITLLKFCYFQGSVKMQKKTLTLKGSLCCPSVGLSRPFIQTTWRLRLNLYQILSKKNKLLIHRNQKIQAFMYRFYCILYEIRHAIKPYMVVSVDLHIYEIGPKVRTYNTNKRNYRKNEPLQIFHRKKNITNLYLKGNKTSHKN